MNHSAACYLIEIGKQTVHGPPCSKWIPSERGRAPRSPDGVAYWLSHNLPGDLPQDF